MKKIVRSLLLLFCYLVSGSNLLFSQVHLPKLISDGMVLQREAGIKIWGWASPGEKVSVRFINATFQAITTDDGKWAIELPKLKAGGPYEMNITGTNTITIHDILIGDVWVCSGQSNMEFVMRSAGSLYAKEIATAANKNIRQFAVPRRYDFNNQFDDVASGSWQTADSLSVLRFSAVAYFFAKDLYERYKVPVGIINATLGGSRAESWMSEDALKQFPNLYQDGQKYKDSSFIGQTERADRQRSASWQRLLKETDQAYKDPFGTWSKPETNTTGWGEMEIPNYWNQSGLGNINGAVWFRKDFTVPASMTATNGKLIFGRIVDADSVFINGIFVGSIPTQYASRLYNIPSSLLRAGKNTIVARIVNSSGRSGFVPGKEYKLVVGKDTINLAGTWKFKLGAKMDPLPGSTTIMWKPAGLYNGMITPLLPYTIKGVIWYQGEANVSRSVEHRTLFPALINNWRNNWHQGAFPFLFVQLPNYNDPVAEPAEGDWAMFRESQVMALSVPNTGMAVTIDLGEFNDIHPLRKKEVGLRLSAAAQHVAYGDNKKVYSGPLYQSMKVEGNKIIISFNHVGGGLVVKGGQALKYFAIAGADKKFAWAKAEIKNNKVVVWNDTITNPVEVRYAWADDPEEANLYNREGFPASPFRTDHF